MRTLRGSALILTFLAVVLVSAAAQHAVASDGAARPTAQLTGRVTAGEDVSAPAPLSVAIDDWVCGKDGSIADPSLVIGPSGGISDVVVTVEVPGAPPMTSTTPAVIDQHKCVFVPHVTLLAPGQELEVRNGDPVLHNFRTISELNRKVNRAQIKGASDTFRFENPEILRAECDVHYWMSAVVVIAPNAFTTVTGSDGTFTLNDLPAGRYPVRLWHQKLGTRTVEVEVGPGGGRLETAWSADNAG